MAYGFIFNKSTESSNSSGINMKFNANSFGLFIGEKKFVAFEADSPEATRIFERSDFDNMFRYWVGTKVVTPFETEEEYKAALAAAQAAIEAQKEIEKAKEITEQQDKEEDDKEKEKKKKRNTIIGVVAGIALLAIALSVINKKN